MNTRLIGPDAFRCDASHLLSPHGMGAASIDAVHSGSKTHALEAGVEASTADALHVDADRLRPVALVRAPLHPTVKQSVLLRWVFDAAPAHRRYSNTMEIFINGVITERRLATAARVLGGVTHPTKRAKFGRVDCYRRT